MRQLSISITLVAVFVAAGCAPSVPRFDDSDANRDVAMIRALAQRADVVFVGTVLEVGAPPRATSGRVRHEQVVRYRVDSVLKGFFNETEVAVEHLLVANSRHADGTALDSNIFAPGRSLIVLVRRVNTFFFQDVNENWGTIPHSAQNEVALLFAM